MKCTIQGCPGDYENRTVVHTVRHRGNVVVIDHVPAEVCSVCGDVLFTSATIRRIEQLLESMPTPSKEVPLYEFA
ncbi:MAG: YgiT-type zinc finger protein [Acidobacteria bacterium]|nr:YgiT-type zinc finger protein [Acidobacteriota bacterium]